MSTPSDSGLSRGSPLDSNSSPASKSFFKRSEKSPGPSKLKDVEQTPSPKRKKNRIARIFKHSSTRDDVDGADEPQTATQRRRQQVYQAQKRHRDRHAEYVKGLEAEIARLQHLDAVVNSEKNALAHQNNAIRELLTKKSIEAQFDLMDIGNPSPLDEELSQLGAAVVGYRFDPELQTDRWFLDTPDLSWTSSDVSSESSPAKPPTSHAPIAGDSWAALDFILALEWPCREHIHHHAINPDAKISEACAVGKFHGHALTATQAVFQSAQTPSMEVDGDANWISYNMGSGVDPDTSQTWLLPHSEIDKLVELAELLDIEDEFMTPAQAYAAVRATVPNEQYLRPTLEALKKPLGTLVDCYGFGAGLDASLFWQHLDSVLQTLQSTRPELG